MLVVEPTALRYEGDASTSSPLHELLVERVSLLETQLLRLVGKLEKTLDLMLRQTRMSQSDHLLIESLLDVLIEAGAVERPHVEERWRAAVARLEEVTTKESVGNPTTATEAGARFTDSYQGAEAEAFGRLIKEGFELSHAGKAARSLRAFERASALAPDNFPLNLYLGEQFVGAGKTTLARAYLERAFATKQADARVCLLLGLMCGDEGETMRARELLRASLLHGPASFAAHYALGRLHAVDGRWQEALEEFRRARQLKPAPELHYVAALACFHLNRYRLALRHVNHALGADERYAEAYFLLGCVQSKLGDEESARAAFAAATLNVALLSPRAAKPRRAVALPCAETLALSFFGATTHRRKLLLTGGDARLAGLFRAEALAFTATTR